jgi:hypothetical protein
MLLKGNMLKENFYTVKPMMKPLGLGYQKIDVCVNFCMIYYGEYANFTECKTCHHSCYKPNSGRERIFFIYKKLRRFLITLSLQRFLMSSKAIEYMTWYFSHDTVDRVMHGASFRW